MIPEIAIASAAASTKVCERGENDGDAVRPALPVAHLARVKAAEILRTERSAEERDGQEQGDQSRGGGRTDCDTAAGRSRDRLRHGPSETFSAARPMRSPPGTPDASACSA